MEQIINETISTLNDQIEKLESDELPKGRVANHAIPLINNCLSQLKQLLISHNFRSPIHEINFFKHTKPNILGKLIFYKRIRTIDTQQTISDIKLKKRLLKNEMLMARLFYDKNINFCHYLSSGDDHLDHVYFLRGQPESVTDGVDLFYGEPDSFTTGFDVLAAHFQAYNMIADYCNDQLNSIKSAATNYKNHHISSQNLTWTETKTSLVELIYAIHATKCINHGKTDIKDIARFFENSFNINLGDYYRNFLQLKLRNKPVKFVETLKNALQQRIDEFDE